MLTLLLLAATVRSFAHMPLGISDRNSCFRSECCTSCESMAAPRGNRWSTACISACLQPATRLGTGRKTRVSSLRYDPAGNRTQSTSCEGPR